MISSAPALTRLVVPRSTGTAGDDLIAWGLARVLAAATGEDVILRDAGTRLVVDVPLGEGELDDCLQAPESLAPAQLCALESPTKQVKAAVPKKDRDALREAARHVADLRRAARAAPDGMVGEPSQTLQEDASAYPLYRVLTSPGTRWTGYNSFVAATPLFTCPDGLRLIVRRFRDADTLSDADLDAALRGLGLRSKDCRRNPPDFLLFGMNKGPTRPLAITNELVVGDAGRADPAMADRGDLSALDLYLAYVGYFSVARVLDSAAGRVVLTPVPYRVMVPRCLDVVRRVVLPVSSLQDYVAVHAALAYAQAVVAYLAELRRDDPAEASRQGTVFHGVALAEFWKPVGTIYSPIRVGLVPIPRWLPAVHAEGWEIAHATLEGHRRQLRALRGRVPDARLSTAQREAFAAYRIGLDGDARDWLVAVTAWFAPLREAARSAAAPSPHPWPEQEIRRIAVALTPSLAEVLDHPSFRELAGAIRAATVHAHFALQRYRQHKAARPAFDPEYDLIAVLAAAAERSPTEFVGELCRFVARYNGAAVRPAAETHDACRRLVRDQALRDVVGWLEADRRGVVAAALLAFGTSLRAREDTAAAPDTEVLDAASATTEEEEQP